MAAYDPLAFGCSLRAHRLKLGWSASQLCELYAEFVGREDSPPNPTFIYHIERGTTMVSQERRAILASLVGMPLTLMGIAERDTATHIDISEYTQSLEWYCHKWREGTLLQSAGAIEQRTNQLMLSSLHATGREKSTEIELFICYQILHADVLIRQKSAIAYDILSSAVERARQEKLPALHAHALTQRAGIVLGLFETTKDPRSIQTAIDDYNNAAEQKDKLSPFYCGLLQVRKGLADAYVARDNAEFGSALHLITQGSGRIGSSTDDVRVVARLDYERYMCNRASAYLYSPMGNAKLGLAELEELDRKHPEPAGKSRLAYRNRLFAEAYLAIGDYPMAAAYLEAGLECASGETEVLDVDRLSEIHTRLKNTSYWNDPDIARIAVKINQIKYPGIFR